MGEIIIYLLDYKIPKYLEGIVDKMYGMYIEEYGSKVVRLTPSKHTKAIQAMSCFCYNAVYNLSFNHREFKITLDEDAYSKPLIYNCTKINRKVSYTYTKSILDWMHSTGKIKLTKGGVTEWFLESDGTFKPKTIKSSTVELSDYLIELFIESADKRKLNTLPSVLEVRDTNGKSISKRLGAYEKEMVRSLNVYNTIARTVQIGIGDSIIDVQLKKVFNNGSFDLGGRNYMVGAGVVSKEDRKIITLDGEETVELDFKALHPRMAATIDGIELDKDFDPYQISVDGMAPEVSRYFGKWAVLILLNTGMSVKQSGGFSFNTARKAIIAKLKERKELDLDKKELALNGVTYKLPTYIDYSDIISKCLERNDYIRLWFHEASGLLLQNYDSKIMDLIIGRFNEMGEIIIPVHDSIVVKKRLETEAREIMFGCFSQVLGNSVNCIIT